ncbi:MAG: serine hydrolase [Gemmatimonadetes bacterium]|nr:serine hydrolase [Gemmatimonadota bacterium]
MREGFSVARLARIDTVLQRYVDSAQVAGMVALVLKDGVPVYERAFGWSDREAQRRMTTDAVFRIASQTKGVTSAAVMALVEEGKIGLNDPVSRFIPSFARSTVAVKSDTGRVVAPARRAITIRDLLTHTSGISYGTDEVVAPLYAAAGLGPVAGASGWYTADKSEPICTTMSRLGTLPFVAQPGEKWVYGYSTDILGCVVEKASGLALDAFIRTRITEPLGLSDTRFFLPAAQRARLAAVYASRADGTVERAPDGPRGQGDYVDGPKVSFAGGAGLLSTAHDYARFLEMIRRGGALDGARVLSPRAAELMHTNMVGALHSTDGLGYGLGFETIDRFGANLLGTEGSYGWGGAYGTLYRVDPKEGLVMVLMHQTMPSRTDLNTRFPTLVYQALVQPRRP